MPRGQRRFGKRAAAAADFFLRHEIRLSECHATKHVRERREHVSPPSPASVTLTRRLTAECVGTAMLLAVVVGSGIMAERLSAGNVAIALLANALATGAGLVALLLALGGVSGAHFNPAVSLAEAARRRLRWSDAGGYVAVQTIGAFAGVAVAHVMFGEPLYAWSAHARPGSSQVFSEAVATFGLLGVIWGSARGPMSATPFAVGAYITAAYWFTSSTSFANPAVTVARAATQTFAGIRLVDVPGFLAGQAMGAAVAILLFAWLFEEAVTD